MRCANRGRGQLFILHAPAPACASLYSRVSRRKLDRLLLLALVTSFFPFPLLSKELMALDAAVLISVAAILLGLFLISWCVSIFYCKGPCKDFDQGSEFMGTVSIDRAHGFQPGGVDAQGKASVNVLQNPGISNEMYSSENLS